eukprot:18139-Heterococcus_DN1.PRE.1
MIAAPRNDWLGNSQFTPLKDPYYFKDKQHIASQRVGFIEIQAPILDTQFFSWFLNEVGVSAVIISPIKLCYRMSVLRVGLNHCRTHTLMLANYTCAPL